MTSYKGYEILSVRPDATNDFTFGVDYRKVELPNPTGVGSFKNLAVGGTDGRVTFTFEWVMQTYAEILAFRDWIVQMQGRVSPFWFDSHMKDVAPAALTQHPFNRCYWDEGLRDTVSLKHRYHYAFHTKNSAHAAENAVQYNRLLGSADTTNPPGTVIATGAFPVDMEFSYFEVNQWPWMTRLYLMRFADDAFTLNHFGRGMATATTRLIEVPVLEYPT